MSAFGEAAHRVDSTATEDATSCAMVARYLARILLILTLGPSLACATAPTRQSRRAPSIDIYYSGMKSPPIVGELGLIEVTGEPGQNFHAVLERMIGKARRLGADAVVQVMTTTSVADVDELDTAATVLGAATAGAVAASGRSAGFDGHTDRKRATIHRLSGLAVRVRD